MLLSVSCESRCVWVFCGHRKQTISQSGHTCPPKMKIYNFLSILVIDVKLTLILNWLLDVLLKHVDATTRTCSWGHVLAVKAKQRLILKYPLGSYLHLYTHTHTHTHAHTHTHTHIDIYIHRYIYIYIYIYIYTVEHEISACVYI